jgi:HD-GYP domain-containing protein (c-di-GMP phosphodiesterase class II)
VTVKGHYRINRFQLVTSLSNALDLVSPHMANHHKRVAYIALRIAAAAGFNAQAKQEVAIAASLHDIGVLSTRERIETSLANSGHHSAAFGYELLRKFHPFQSVAELIRFQHVPWDQGRGQRFRDATVPMGSHIINLANRIDSAVEPEVPILVQTKAITREVTRLLGSVIVPEFGEALLGLARSESFWLDLVSPGHDELLASHAAFSDIELDMEGLLQFAEMWGQVIDFRSRFTATHSSGVAACAHALAQVVGFPEQRCRQLKVAGYLHDIGKLAIPMELLEKTGKLDNADRLTIRAHSYYSYRILQPIAGLEEIAEWCGFHHEKLDGAGYPYGMDRSNLALEARIVAVADVFSALTEDRPYRPGLDQNAVTAILKEMVAKGQLDPKLVAALCDNYDALNQARIEAQRQAVKGYETFTANLRALDLAWAREAHLSWAQRIREAMRDPAPVDSVLLSPENCPLGKWSEGDGLVHYGHLREFRELKKYHRDLHTCAERLVRQRAVGCNSEDGCAAEELDRLSHGLLHILDGIAGAQGIAVPGSARM